MNATLPSGFKPARRPAPVAAANAAWRTLHRVGLAKSSLDEASLIAAARKASGLQHFGDESAGSFREPMRRLLAALEAEARLHPIGRFALRQILVRWLVTRLRLVEACERHPEIARTPVDSPVFIAGLQRTGTTLLHRLLSCESVLRPLLSWEALSPIPVPLTPPGRPADSNDPSARDPRMKLGEAAERGLRYMAPEFFAIHPVEAHSPEEDVLLMDLSFISPTADATLTVPSYSEWLAGCDQTPAYRILRRMIQLLLWQHGGEAKRWLGKTPHHLEHIDCLQDVFPGAKIIQTHRDPIRVVASFCSMISHGRAVFSDEVDPRQVGAQLAATAVRAVNRSMATRASSDASQFLDVHYADLVSDPLKQIGRIYDFLGLELTPDTEQTMRDWQKRNPQHKHGVHHYRLADFGLDREQLVEQFRPYCERFEIPLNE